MPDVIVNTQYSEREELVYCFTLLSGAYQYNNYCQDDQMPKLVAALEKDLRTELKEFSYLLPFFCHKTYKLSLFSNCRRLFIPDNEGIFLSAEELIAAVLTNDPDELTARVFMTADNNANQISFYRTLIVDSLDAVKYALEMDIDQEVRTMLLSLLVDRKAYHKKIVNFAFKTLDAIRRVFPRRDYAIKKTLSAFGNGEKAAMELINAGYIGENEEIILTPILLNPYLIYINHIDNVRYVRLGITFEDSVFSSIGTNHPTLELELIGKIFGDPTRCEIIRKLKDRGSYLTNLAKQLEMPTNSLHYHIQALSDAGVIKGSYKGKRFVYELNPHFFNSASNTLKYFSL